VPPFSGLNSVSIQIWQRAIPHGGRWQADGEGTHRLDREGGAGARRQRELGRVEGVVGVQPTQQRLGVLRRRRQLATGGRVIECQLPSARAQKYYYDHSCDYTCADGGGHLMTLPPMATATGSAGGADSIVSDWKEPR
jgi:hypothetical protein